MYRSSIGILFLKSNEYDQAIQILENCVKEEPNNSTYQWFLAIAYSEKTYQSWTYVPDGSTLSVDPGYYATKKAHVDEAEKYIAKAENLKFDDDELSSHLQSVKNDILKMNERKFYGNWLVTAVWILLGLVSFGQSAFGGIMFVAIAGFYIYASRPPQYKLNRKILLGQRPSGGWDGILWVIIAYPVMAIYNYYNNYIAE
jgi:tetratricopeptide (TPR) repeat protein